LEAGAFRRKLVVLRSKLVAMISELGRVTSAARSIASIDLIDALSSGANDLT
jgi:hypothetical protein